MNIGLWISIGAVAALLFCSAFFSVSETAVTAASRPRLHRLAQVGNRRAKIVNRLRERQPRLIGAILLGNNVVNILASVLTTSVLIATMGEAGVVYATITMTVLIVVFTEVLPKTYAIHRPVRTALAVAPVLGVLVAMLSPVTRTVDAIVRQVLRWMGVRLEPGLSAAAIEEELRGTIDLHASVKKGVSEERRMLHSVLDLAELEVGDVTTHRRDVYSIDSDLSAETIIAQVLASPYTRAPLWRGETDNIVGVLSVKAVLRALQAEGGGTARTDPAALATAPWFVPDATTLLDQLRAFRERREHFAVVVDEYGTYEGVVTLEDIVEEIVGEIFDEHEAPVAGVRLQSDGSFVARGTVAVRDLNRLYGWSLPEEGAATIAGLVIRESRTIPEPGQIFEFHGFRFEILRRQRNRITSVRVTPPFRIATAAV